MSALDSAPAPDRARQSRRVRFARRFDRLARTDGSEPTELTQRRQLTTAFNLMIVPAALVWAGVYASFGERLAASIPLAYAVLSVSNLLIYQGHARLWMFRDVQLLLILLLPFALSLVLGGFAASSGVILWSLVAPLAALVLCGRQGAVLWFVGFTAAVVLGVLAEPLAAHGNSLPSWLVDVFFGLNLATPSLAALLLLVYFVGQKDRAMALLAHEREKAERLLLNVLPREIASVLRDGQPQGTIAEYHPAVSVLFADMVDSTEITARLSPERVVELLNEVFSYFDALVNKYGVEKIRTIGDNYMVAAGVPVHRPDHAHVLAALALEMNEFVNRGGRQQAAAVRFRIGMNCGPVVAGVVGTHKFQYDVWGDAVNTASRMESHGEPGRIQITRQMYELIRDRFRCTPRGVIDIKGKGDMETWFLEGAIEHPSMGMERQTTPASSSIHR
jgi:adenylate cyclase